MTEKMKRMKLREKIVVERGGRGAGGGDKCKRNKVEKQQEEKE